MIDDKTKLIFVENPKSASSAVKQALTGVELITFDDPRIATINHSVPAEIATKYPQKWRDYHSFVVVRNTWDRALSFFRFYTDTLKEESYQKYTFDEWVALGCPAPKQSAYRAILPFSDEGKHVLCQMQYVEGVEHVIVLHSFEPLIRARQLREQLMALAGKLKFSLFPVRHDVNKSTRQPAKECWTAASVANIAMQFEDEINYFGFEPPELK